MYFEPRIILWECKVYSFPTTGKTASRLYSTFACITPLPAEEATEFQLTSMMGLTCPLLVTISSAPPTFGTALVFGAVFTGPGMGM